MSDRDTNVNPPEFSEASELHSALGEILAVIERFQAEAQIIMAHMEEADQAPEQQQFWRRSMVRMVSSELEAITHQLKQSAYGMWRLTAASFTLGELALLKEEEYRLIENGSLKVKKAKLSMLPNFRFAIKCYSRVLAPDYSLKVDVQGWELLQEAVKIRDRITHPKSAEDLLISYDEAGKVWFAQTWFLITLHELIQSSTVYAEKMAHAAKARAALL